MRFCAGGESRVLAWAAAVTVWAAAAGAGPVRYVKKPTARETLEASLSGPPLRQADLGAWFYAGAFEAGGKGFGESHVPVRDVDLKQTFRDKGGRRIGWRKGSRFRDGQVNDLRIFPDNDRAAVYLYRTIHSKVARALPVALGSDDGIVVWLNGRRVLAHQVTRACRLGDERAVLDLAAGRNELLIKIVNGSGPSGFAFAVGSAGDTRQLLLDRIARDFPPEQVHELIVETDWMRWDDLTGAAPDYRAAAGRALALTERTAEAVAARGAGREFAPELAKLRAEHQRAGERTGWRDLYLRTRRLRRRIALADPLLDFQELLIVKRCPPGYSHMCDQNLGRHSRGGPGLMVLERWRTAPRARPMLPEGALPEGTVLHPDLSFDGRRVLFAFCDHTVKDRSKRCFHIREAGADGTGLRRLTGGPGDPMETAYGRRTVLVEDIDPCYLPDGGFTFISTRNQGFGRCHGGRYTPSYVLYRADLPPAGATSTAAVNVRRISFGEANEWEPSVLNDGRIAYCRWDYVNRHDTLYQSLWVTRPDGTATALIYGNNTRNPCMTSEAKAIPGSHKIACTAAAHHAYSAGSIIVIDPSRGSEGSGPVRRITPEVGFPETEGYPRRMYATPWPLSEDAYLAAYSFAPLRSQGGVQDANAFAIYLVDAAGGRELIYRDPNISCFSPIPLRPRPRPAVLASAVRPEEARGVFFALDVCRGLEGVPRGTVKHLRVVRMFEQPTARVPHRSAVSNEIVKKVLGTVPVGADGSVAFRAPAGVPLLLQLLDEHHLSVMSMRSQVYLQGGERASCVGCHEGRNTAPPVVGLGAMRVRDIVPPPGPTYAGGLSFARTVQPVLDRHCIRCHGLGKAPMSLIGEPTGRFNAAYEALVARRGMVSLAHRNSERPYSTERLYGAHAGRLAGMLLGPHAERVKLDSAGFRRIAAWLDLNGQYYGDYSFARPERRRPDAKGVAALREHLRRRCGSCHASLPDAPLAALVNVALPGESRVLMAPLDARARGWGQCQAAWKTAAAPGYRQMLRKVLAATGPPGPRAKDLAGR